MADAAAALRAEIDRQLVSEIEVALLRGAAHARLERALIDTVTAVGHQAITVENRITAYGGTCRVRFLGSVMMTWSFSERWVDVYCRAGGPRHLRLRFAPEPGEWRISLPGRAARAGTFTDEEDKVLEVLRDMIRALPSADPG